MVDVRDAHAEFTDANINVVAVTMGSVKQAARFKDDLDLPFTCLADPDQTLYSAFKVPRGRINSFAGPAVWFSGLRSLLRSGLGKPIGDVRQMQAAFVIDTSGKLILRAIPRIRRGTWAIRPSWMPCAGTKRAQIRVADSWSRRSARPAPTCREMSRRR